MCLMKVVFFLNSFFQVSLKVNCLQQQGKLFTINAPELQNKTGNQQTMTSSETV